MKSSTFGLEFNWKEFLQNLTAGKFEKTHLNQFFISDVFVAVAVRRGCFSSILPSQIAVYFLLFYFAN